MTLTTDGHYYENKIGRFYYQVHGPEDAPAINFSIGVMMDHRTFDPQVQAAATNKPLGMAGLSGHSPINLG